MEWRGGLEVAQLQFHLRIQHGLVGLIPIDEHREFANAETPNHFERLGACLQARSAAALDLSSGPVKMLAIGTMGTRGRETDIGECKQGCSNVPHAVFFEIHGVTPSACNTRSEEHTSELQSQSNLVCRLLLEKKKKKKQTSKYSRPG